MQDLGSLKGTYDASTQAVNTTTRNLTDRIDTLRDLVTRLETSINAVPTMERIESALEQHTKHLATKEDVARNEGRITTVITLVVGIFGLALARFVADYFKVF
jgi:hypothetical protein